MIDSADSLGVPPLVKPTDITSGNVKINTVFVASIFYLKHGLEELTAAEYDAAKFLDDDIEGSKEERQFRYWINSLNIDDVYVNNLYEEARDGLLLLRVIHKLDNTVIDWKKIDLNPNNKFK
jgi:plastin-1